MTRLPLSRRGQALFLSLIMAACSSQDGTDESDLGPLDGAVAVDAAALGDGSRFDAAVTADAERSDDARDAERALDADTARDAAREASADIRRDAGADAAAFTAMALADPPSYVGTKGGSSSCVQTYRTAGQLPVQTASAKHPLFLYFVGTRGGDSDESARFDGKAAQRVNRAMAERGFVALSVEYDNALSLESFLADKIPCLFGKANAESLIARACALPSVDCGLGIATWGHSQGALLAHRAADVEPRVRAVWTTGYSGFGASTLPFNRFRTVNGEYDGMNGTVAASNKTAGFSAADQCPDDGRDRCLRADGSGWIIVRRAACKSNAADHCWFNKVSCATNTETLEPNWDDRESGTPFAIEDNADWVARTVARP